MAGSIGSATRRGKTALLPGTSVARVRKLGAVKVAGAQDDGLNLSRSDLLIAAAQRMGFALRRDDFAIRCDSQSALWQLVQAGLGITFAQQNLVLGTPGMVVLDLALPIPPLEVWLTSHKELYGSRRIRAVFDRLAELLSAWLKAPHPRAPPG